MNNLYHCFSLWRFLSHTENKKKIVLLFKALNIKSDTNETIIIIITKKKCQIASTKVLRESVALNQCLISSKELQSIIFFSIQLILDSWKTIDGYF